MAESIIGPVTASCPHPTQFDRLHYTSQSTVSTREIPSVSGCGEMVETADSLGLLGFCTQARIFTVQSRAGW